MESNIKAINLYLSKNPTYPIVKKKDTVFIIKDGIISYKIDTHSYECQCSNKLCNHLIFFMTNSICGDIRVLKFFHKLRPILKETKQNTNLILEATNILNDECGICTAKMNYYDNLHECSKCFKYCHSVCLTRWINTIKNTKNDKNCIYCHSVSYI
jgi:hypothetical protein